MEIGGGWRLRWSNNTQSSSSRLVLLGRSRARAHPPLPPAPIARAVFLSREIVVRRFIYARSAKFTGCVAGAALINHAESALNVPGAKSDDDGGGAFPHFFIGPRPGYISPLRVSVVFAKPRVLRKTDAEECNTAKIITVLLPSSSLSLATPVCHTLIYLSVPFDPTSFAINII